MKSKAKIFPERNKRKANGIQKIKNIYTPGPIGPWTNYLTSLKFLGIDIEKMLIEIKNFKEERPALCNYIIKIKNKSGSLQTPFSEFSDRYCKEKGWIFEIDPNKKLLSAQVKSKYFIPLLKFGLDVENILCQVKEIDKERTLLIFYAIHLKETKELSLKVC